LGEYANRTKALQQATGKYLIFIDGDDLMYEHALSTLARYIEFFPECAMYFSREWDPRILCPFKVDPLTIYRFEYLDGGIMGGNFTKVLFKTEILKDYSFPEGIRSGDSYIQLKIAQQHPALVVPGGLTWWRRRKDNASHQLFSDNRHFAESIRYRSALLGEGCPLSEPEIKQAKINMYGVYMRQLIRLLFAGEFADLVYLVRHVKIPVKYWLRIFSRSKHNFYADLTGDRPLHTHIPFK
jgi:glycosyltransferase involved in cell wall biosynthesis